MTLYQLHTEIHTLVQEKAKKYGKEIKHNDYWYILRHNNPLNEWQLVHRDDVGPNDYSHFTPAIQAPQIRQILLAFKEPLGETNAWLEFEQDVKEADYDVCECQECGVDLTDNLNTQYKAEALCNRWLDGLEPMFESQPEKVLEEVIEMLKTI